MTTNAAETGERKSPTIPKVKLNSGYEIPLVAVSFDDYRVRLRTGPCLKLAARGAGIVGYGTYHISGDNRQEVIDKVVDAALTCGYRLFDTAKLYQNEPELGVAFEKLLPKHGLRREDIFITTKFFPPAGGAMEKVPKLIEESLANLRTDYVDLVLVHYPKSDTMSAMSEGGRENDDPLNAQDRREAWLALESIPPSKVHSIGVSNFEPNHLEEMASYVKLPAVNQVEYHPHFRREALKNYCAEKGIFFQAFSSLARNHPDLVGDPVVKRLAEKHHTSVSTILLSFATSQGVGVVPKSETPERIKSNLDCLNVKLSDEELAELNSIPKDGNYIRTTGWLVK